MYKQNYTAPDWEPFQIFMQITVPDGYSSSRGVGYPVVLAHHGWSGNENSMKARLCLLPCPCPPRP